jgi:signal peptidase II
MRWEERALSADAQDGLAGESPVAPVASSTPAPAAVAPSHARLLWWLSIAVIAVDQGTKALVRAKLDDAESITVIPNLLDFTHVQNKGVAFGLLNDAALPFKGGLTSALALVALVGIGLYARHVRREEWLARIGLSLILGGAVGNLIDRLLAGSVVDFVDVYWRTWHFWAFNVADASITIGAILVFLDLLLVPRHASDSV